MGKWKHMERLDSNWGNSLKDKGDSYSWEDEVESLEMVWLYSEESN